MPLRDNRFALVEFEKKLTGKNTLNETDFNKML